ncbi:MAG: hypothetical protein KGH57_00495 [Candidatus Micrarchaeota archaeon]|nr:hypothetical protein [Candidatus Micrarchaeota archaeon]
MDENIVALFSLGWFNESTGLLRIQTTGDMRTMIFTDKRVIAAHLADPENIYPPVKPHTREYEEALAKMAKDRVNSLSEKGFDMVVQGDRGISVSYDEIQKILFTRMPAPELHIHRNRGSEINFKIIDNTDLEASLNAIKQAFPDKVKW